MLNIPLEYDRDTWRLHLRTFLLKFNLASLIGISADNYHRKLAMKQE
jgi:hypothetical protein